MSRHFRVVISLVEIGRLNLEEDRYCYNTLQEYTLSGFPWGHQHEARILYEKLVAYGRRLRPHSHTSSGGRTMKLLLLTALALSLSACGVAYTDTPRGLVTADTRDPHLIFCQHRHGQVCPGLAGEPPLAFGGVQAGGSDAANPSSGK